MSPDSIPKFRAFVLRFHQDHGRHSLPWRTEATPYRVLVSEVMLQQTQVDRVVPKFNQFVSQFPTINLLAEAPVSAVITAWQGLGYNRRGLNLQRAAQVLADNYQGEVPSTLAELISLPGIGPYTAAAIQAFAFNQSVTVIETNIRAVFIYHFFHQTYSVTDSELKPIIEATVWADNPRVWYSALMDYGTHLKQVLPNPSRQSRHYVKQSKFNGSLRQIRGQVLAQLTAHDNLPKTELISALTGSPEQQLQALTALTAEGFIVTDRGRVSLKK